MARNNGLSLVARLNISLSESQISDDLKKISDDLDKQSLPSFIAHINTQGSANAINKELAALGKKLKVDFGQITEGTNKSQLKSAGKKVAKEVYNVQELKAAGRDYLYNANDIQKQIDQLQSRYDKRNISLQNSVNVSALTNEVGQVKALRVEYENLEHQMVRVDYIKAKFDNKKWGFVSTGATYSDKTEGKAYQETLSYMAKIESSFRKIHDSATGFSSPIKEGSKFFEQYNAKAESVAKTITQIRSENKILSDEQKTHISSLVSSFEAYVKNLKESAKGATSLSPKNLSESIKQSNAELNTMLKSLVKNKQESGELGKAYRNIIKDISGLKTQLNSVTNGEEFAQYSANLKLVRENIKQYKIDFQNNSGINQLAVQATNLSTKINLFISENSRLSENAKTKLRELANQAQQAQSKMDLSNINTQFNTFTMKLREAGKLGTSIIDKLKQNLSKFSAWFSMTTVIMRVIALMRQMITNVKELDTAMTNLKKVTDETDQTYQNFFKNAGRSAQELHADLNALIDATADFAKLGYSINEAEELAKSAVVYQNVGELDSIQDATSSIVSTMKAFKVEAKDAMTIVDKFNKVGNEFSISSAGIGDGLRRSASALATAGVDINEAIGLIVGSNAVIQDPDVVGKIMLTLNSTQNGGVPEVDNTVGKIVLFKIIKGGLYWLIKQG